MKMDIVVDIQCVKDFKNRAIPKEVAVLSLDQNLTGHWIVSPNSKITTLCQEAGKENDWLSQNHHGLDWLDQGVSAKVLFKNLEEICNWAKNIYVRGGTKVGILRKITTRHINLKFQDDCPPFHKLTASSNYCMHHALKFCFSKYSCALNNAFEVKTWLNTSDKTQAVNLLRTGLVDISTTNFVRHSTWQIIWFYVQILSKKKVQFQRKNPRLEKVKEFAFEPPMNLCDEQYSNSTDFISNSYSRCGSLCGRSYPIDLDETDSFYFQHPKT